MSNNVEPSKQIAYGDIAKTKENRNTLKRPLNLAF